MRTDGKQTLCVNKLRISTSSAAMIALKGAEIIPRKRKKKNIGLINNVLKYIFDWVLQT